MKQNAIIYLILLITSISCQKTYEEGPFISFRNSGKRLIGEWKFDHYYIGGIDSVSFYNDGITFDHEDGQIYWEWSIEGDNDILRFYSHKIIIGNDTTYPYYPLGGGPKTRWFIKKLTNKELIVEAGVNDMFTRIEMTKTENIN